MEEMWQFVVADGTKVGRSDLPESPDSYDRPSKDSPVADFQSRPGIARNPGSMGGAWDTSLVQAECLRGDQIKVAVEQDIEV